MQPWQRVEEWKPLEGSAAFVEPMPTPKLPRHGFASVHGKELGIERRPPPTISRGTICKLEAADQP